VTFARSISMISSNKKHLKNVGPIHHFQLPHAHSPDVASGTVACRLRIDAHDNADDDNDNAWQRGPLWPHGMGPMIPDIISCCTSHARCDITPSLCKSAIKLQPNQSRIQYPSECTCWKDKLWKSCWENIKA